MEYSIMSGCEGVRVIRITEGLKLWMANKKSCLELEKKLNEIGVKTRAVRNCEIDLWSIYVISVPENLVNTEVKYDELE